jgi:excisionase family DNA binding protein
MTSQNERSVSETERQGLTNQVVAALRLLASDAELTPEEAAREARVSRQTIYTWLRRGVNPLPARKKGRRFWLIRRGDLARYMEENPSPDSQDPLRRLSELPGFEHLIPDSLRVTLHAWDWLRARERWDAANEALDLPAIEVAYEQMAQARQALDLSAIVLDEPAMESVRAFFFPAEPPRL